MKKITRLVVLALFFMMSPWCYSQNQEQPRPRVIEVTGSAELEVLPDEIYLSITLREYLKDKNKVKLDDIDKAFKNTLNELKIDLKNASIESASAYYDWDYWKQRHTEFLASKTYIIKLPDMNKYNALMQALDQNGVQHAYLQRTDNSKIEEYRRQVKVEALKAAKEKARLLLESIGEQPAEVLFIKELNQGNYYPMYRGVANMAMESTDAGGGAMNADVQKIKLKYEVEAHFRIK
jgi:uncharacterized protein YggE